jgi:hypothetical protein
MAKVTECLPSKFKTLSSKTLILPPPPQKRLRIHRVEEGAVIQTKGIENLFNEIIAENSPNLEKDINIQVQEAFRTLNGLDQKITSPCT